MDKKINIGILTFSCNSNNFGAAMQALALRRKLVSMGYNVWHIATREAPHIPRNVKEAASIVFNKKHLNYMMKSDIAGLNSLDAVVCGSDQIWSAALSSKLNPHYFGLFSPLKENNITRISYAASLGATDLSDEELQKDYKEMLKDFSSISIREEKHKAQLEEITGKPVSVVLDPTFLLDRYAYSDLVTEYNPYGQDYIYAHLHKHVGRDKVLVELTKKLSGLLGLPIVHNIRDTVFPNELGTTRNMGQDGVVNAIRHSKYVMTQSFHGLAFSLIFEKPFLILGHGNALDARVEGLLKTLNLHERFIDRYSKGFPVPIALKDIDYSDVYKRLEQLKATSSSYLFDALKNVKKREKPADYFTTGIEFYCYGCGTCKEKCPVGAIDLEQNREEFWFPVVKNNCNHCGLCSKVCPHNVKPKLTEYNPKAYLAFSTNEEIHRNSSSGGMFMTFAKEILKRSGYVIGVKTVDVIRAVYDIAYTEEGAREFCYSKYVEPEHNDIYSKTLAALETERPVLFTGTPCKIAGLRTFLGEDYDNLYTAEILCKGYPSSLALKKYVDFKEKGRGSKITYLQFRSNLAPAKSAAIEMRFEDGREEVGLKRKHYYMRAFSKNWALRKSCYYCEFKKNNYLSDITFGDAWGLEHLYEKEVPEGLSCLKINTPKGGKLFEMFKDEIFHKEVTVDEMFKSNVKAPVAWKALRSEFYQALENENIQQVVDRFVELEK